MYSKITTHVQYFFLDVNFDKFIIELNFLFYIFNICKIFIISKINSYVIN